MATKVLSLPIGIILARGLGAGGKGSLSLIQLTAATSVVIFGFGMGNAFSYYAARGEARGRDAVTAALMQATAVLLVMLAGYAAAGPWIARTLLQTDDSVLLLGGMLATGPALVTGLTLPFVIGSGSVRRGTEITLTALGAQLVAYVAAALLGRLSLSVAVSIWVSAVVLESLLLCLTAWRVTQKEEVRTGTWPLLKRSFRYGGAVWLASLLGFSALRVDMFLLGGLENVAAVGVYSIAVTFAELLWFVPGALAGVLTPKIAAEREGSLDLTFRLSRVLWVLMAASAVAVVAVAIPAIPFLFGKAFGGAILPLVLLIPGVVATAAANPAGAHLLGMGRPIYGTAAAAANVAVNVGLNLVLIPRFHAAGAAISSSVSYTVSAAIVTFFFMRMTDSRLSELFVPKSADFRSILQGFRAALSRS